MNWKETTLGPLRISLRGLLLVFLLVTLAIRWPFLAELAVPVAPFFLVRQYVDVSRRTALARYVVLLVAIYLPVVVAAYVTPSDYFKELLQHFTIVPGILPTMFCGVPLSWSALPRFSILHWPFAALPTLLAFGIIAGLYRYSLIGRSQWLAANLVGSICSFAAAHVLLAMRF